MSRGRYERKRINKAQAVEAAKAWLEWSFVCEQHPNPDREQKIHIPMEIPEWIAHGKPIFNLCVCCQKRISRVFIDDRHVSKWFLVPYEIEETP